MTPERESNAEYWSPTPLRWCGVAAVVGGGLFAAADFVAFFAADLGGPDEEITTNTYAAWSALSLFALALLQIALVGLYSPIRAAAGTLGWVGFLLAFFGMTIAFFVVLVYAFINSSLTPEDPELLNAGPPMAFLLYFPLFSLGWLLLGLAFLRSSAYPRPAALLLVVGAVLVVHPHPLTTVLFSAAVMWLGLTLLSGGSSPPRTKHPGNAPRPPLGR